MLKSDSSCYEIKKESNDSFFFVTETGVKYEAVFRHSKLFYDYECYNSRLYEFSFSTEPELTRENKTKSNKTTNTLLSIISQYMNDEETILIYVCDPIQNRKYARERLFRNWFNKFSYENHVLIDNMISNDLSGIRYRAFSIINDQNCEFDKAVAALNVIASKLSNDPQKKNSNIWG